MEYSKTIIFGLLWLMQTNRPMTKEYAWPNHKHIHPTPPPPPPRNTNNPSMRSHKILTHTHTHRFFPKHGWGQRKPGNGNLAVWMVT